MNFINPIELSLIFPEIILTTTFVSALIIELVYRRRNGHLVGAIACAGILSAMLSAVMLFPYPSTSAFAGMIQRDSFGTFSQLLVGLAAFITILTSSGTKEVSEAPTAGRGEYYLMVLSATIGMFLLVISANLLMLYISMELLSLSSYLLTGWFKRSKRSAEAGVKYIVYGAAASCSMIYGISLFWGVTGSLSLDGIKTFLLQSTTIAPLFVVALLFTLAGFFFKVAAFPLFQWAPDVYQGAPTPIAAFLAVGSKSAGMAALLRFVFTGFAAFSVDAINMVTSQLNLPMFIAVISAATMTVGNFMALGQNNIKRLLAYSSIAHAGYVLMGIPAMTEYGLKAVLFYLVVYLLMNMGAFLVVAMLENEGIEGEVPLYRGMGGRAPAVAVSMSIFLFSLTGLPPFAGFIGKVYLFASVIKSQIYWLAIIGVLNSVVSLYYYARIVKAMFLEKADESLSSIKVSSSLSVIMWGLAVPTVLLGIYWSPLINIAIKAVQTLGM